MADQKEIDSARKLARALSVKVDRQAKTLEDTRQQLTAVEAYIRGLEKAK